MRVVAALGSLLFASTVATGCRWSTEVHEYASGIAQPTEADRLDPPEEQPLACTDEGFTVVVGPEPGCAMLEGIAGGGVVASEDFFRHDPVAPMAFATRQSATPIRILSRSARVTDVEVVLRCRPFFNDARSALLFRHEDPTCETTELILATDCGFGGRFDDTLHGAAALELRLAGDGIVADVRACVRPDP